jgi:hypothetical protein
VTKINTTGVPSDKQNDQRFVEELKLLEKELSVPGATRAICVHEAGHLIYFRLLGESLNIPPERFCFVGPSITYDSSIETDNPFGHFVAATGTPFDETDLDYTDEILLKLSKACFAGGVSTHELEKGSLRGDTSDYVKFHRYYKQAIKQRGQMEILESALTENAIALVTADLQSATIRDQIRSIANYLEAEHFSSS